MFFFSHIFENQDGFDGVCGFPETDMGIRRPSALRYVLWRRCAAR